MSSPLSKKQRVYLFIKRGFDIFGSLLGIIILSPLMILVAIVTKLTSKGPVIFKQNRVGRHHKMFKIYKFRSMKVGVPNVAPEYLTSDTQRNMTTKWGHFLRKTSIDEYPQLFNILKGDMSFIGPRPSLPEEPELIEARDSYYPSPYEIRPGLSGYAQMKTNRSHDANLKAEWDHYYVSHLSLWLDIKTFAYSLLILFGLRSSGN